MNIYLWYFISLCRYLAYAVWNKCCSKFCSHSSNSRGCRDFI